MRDLPTIDDEAFVLGLYRALNKPGQAVQGVTVPLSWVRQVRTLLREAADILGEMGHAQGPQVDCQKCQLQRRIEEAL
jgi:hypothetical protein